MAVNTIRVYPLACIHILSSLRVGAFDSAYYIPISNRTDVSSRVSCVGSYATPRPCVYINPRQPLGGTAICQPAAITPV